MLHIAVVLEMKVNEAAVVSIYAPPPSAAKNEGAVEVVKFTEHAIEFIRDLTPGA